MKLVPIGCDFLCSVSILLLSDLSLAALTSKLLLENLCPKLLLQTYALNLRLQNPMKKRLDAKCVKCFFIIW